MKVTAVLGAMAKRFETGCRWKDSFESEVYKRAVDFGESVEEARKAREARCLYFYQPARAFKPLQDHDHTMLRVLSLLIKFRC